MSHIKVKEIMEWRKVTVVFCILCVWKCSAMTLNEIEDFKDFLEKTSQLDQILVKKGTSPDNDIDEDEAISDYAWEESGKFEGDLILNDRQRRLIVEDVAEGLSRNGLKDITKRWPDNELVYYIQREHFNEDQVQAIQDGIDDLAQAACVKFRPYRKGDRDAVVIQGSRRGCFSNVGYQGGYQVLNLNGRHPPGRGCFRHGTIVHELLHSLGFYHMQSSPDRDDYIDVMWENIHEPAKHNFRKYNTFSVSDYGVGYDYDSVLHYGRRAFSRNGQDTLVPKQSGASIGQRLRLSDKDVQKLNKMYCDAESNNNDAAEESTAKPINKKENPKNKPFQGHGIGYHQGKTVLIRLPAAETIKLTNTPIFQLFDHFSKTPEAMPKTIAEGVGAGKEITFQQFHPEDYYSNEEPYSDKKYMYTTYSPEEHDTSLNLNAKDDNVFPKRTLPEYDSEKKDLLDQLKPKVIENSSNDTSTLEDHKDTFDETDHDYSGKLSDVVDEAFNRLGKIIKTHVYPSQTPDLNAYKAKLDYSKFYTPKNTFDSEPKIVKVDKEFGPTMVTSTIKENSSAEKENINKKEKVESSEPGETPESHNDHVPRGFDSSFGTAYPLKNMPKLKEEAFITPEYATYEHLADKHDYSDFYEPRNEASGKNGKHTLFGYFVPLHHEVIDGDIIKKDNEKYGQDTRTYTYSPDNEHEHASSQLTQYEYDRPYRNGFNRVPSSTKGYSLFGVLVPLSQKWYKTDYAPHSGSYSIQKPESSEDYR